MKPKPSTPRRKKPTAVIPLVIRRPFANPIPLQDELMKRCGPKHPTKPGTQI